jgi:hypothetical protein
MDFPGGGTFLEQGYSLDLAVSLINHCCTPNIIVFFDGRLVRARSLRPIKAGEELVRCYVEVSDPVLLRHEGYMQWGGLRDGHFIDCKCETNCLRSDLKYPS